MILSSISSGLVLSLIILASLVAIIGAVAFGLYAALMAYEDDEDL